MKVEKVDAILDAKGLLCPMPIVKLSKKVKEMGIGEVLEIQADDEGAKQDIPAWCAKTGNEFLGIEDAGVFTRYYIRKASS